MGDKTPWEQYLDREQEIEAWGVANDILRDMEADSRRNLISLCECNAVDSFGWPEDPIHSDDLHQIHIGEGGRMYLGECLVLGCDCQGFELMKGKVA